MIFFGMEFEKKIRKIREMGSEKCKEGVQERLTLLFKEGKERKGFHFLRCYKCLFWNTRYLEFLGSF